VVRADTRLDRLAAELGLPTAEIASANNLDPDSAVQAGRRIALPSTPIAFDGRRSRSTHRQLSADGHAIVPLRAVIEEAGGQVSWTARSIRRAPLRGA